MTPTRRPAPLRPLATLALALGLCGMLGGCVLVPAGPGWCYWHPYRCR